MKKNEKLNEKESIVLGTYIVGLYGACDSRTKEALIMTFLEDMKEREYNIWFSIMKKNILE